MIFSCLLLEDFNPKGRIINLITTKNKSVWSRNLDKFASNLDFSYNRERYEWIKTYILSKLTRVHLSQYLGNYYTNQKIDIKVVSDIPDL